MTTGSPGAEMSADVSLFEATSPASSPRSRRPCPGGAVRPGTGAACGRTLVHHEPHGRVCNGVCYECLLYRSSRRLMWPLSPFENHHYQKVLRKRR